MCDVAGRYFLHDLVRDCAYSLLLDHDDPSTRRAAQHRLFDYYLYAVKLWTRDRAVGAFRFEPTVRHVPTHVPAAESDEAGTARLGRPLHRGPPARRPRRRAGLRQPDHAGLSTLVRARELARQSLTGRAEAAIVNNLGTVCRDLGRYPEALTHFEHALALHRRDGAHLPGLLTEWNIGTLSHLQGDYSTPVEVFDRMLFPAGWGRREAVAGSPSPWWGLPVPGGTSCAGCSRVGRRRGSR